jgi:membrane-bound serine protease (ClpP class)
VSRTLPSWRRTLVITALTMLSVALTASTMLAASALPAGAADPTTTATGGVNQTTVTTGGVNQTTVTTGGVNQTTVTTGGVNDAGDQGSTADAGFVAVLKVSGLLDPVMVDAIAKAVRDANTQGARSLVLQANANGVIVPEATYVALLDQMASSAVPIDVWVGPSGSALTGPAAQLVGVAREVGMAPGTSLGNAGPMPVGVPFNQERMTPLINDRVGSKQAADLGVTTVDAPTIGDFIINLPGVQTRQDTNAQGQTRRLPVTQVQFNQLSLVSQLFHTVASPAVAYLLLTVGLALLIFELFTAGVGVAGVVGAGAFILSCYGLAVLPTHWWGLLAIVAAMLAFAIDVQTGVPRFWTAAGMVLYVVGSFTLYHGVSISWITLAVGVVGVGLTFFTAMPAMVRTRFSTPTIGREWMIGELGRAVTAVDPDGTVQLRGALWRAYTNRATPIEELDRVRVIGIEGLVLEVEPEEGAARDYRERGPKEASSD